MCGETLNANDGRRWAAATRLALATIHDPIALQDECRVAI